MGGCRGADVVIVGAGPAGALRSRTRAQAAGRPAREGHQRVSGGEAAQMGSHPLRGVPGSTGFTRAVPRLEGEGSMKSCYLCTSLILIVFLCPDERNMENPFHVVIALRG